MFIYLIVNHETGKYYVGQHKGSNLKKYLQQKFHHAQRGISERSHLYNSMRAHPDPKVWSIHALRSDIQTREELDETERDFIKFLRATDPEYGYNICRGGEGFTGPHSAETRRKISKAGRKWALDPANEEAKKLRIMRLHEARKKHKRPSENKVCPVCHTPFSVPFGWKNRIYCSRFCSLQRLRTTEFEQERLNSLRQSLKLPKSRINMSTAQAVRRKAERERGVKPTPHIWTQQERIIQAERMRSVGHKNKGRTLSDFHKHTISNALKGLMRDEKRKNSLDKGRHTRWHSSRGVVSKDCRFCLEGLSKPN
jgi:hypothetical protein